MPRMPGQALLALARRLLCRAEIDRIVEPAIADLQHEWRESGGQPLVTRASVRTRAYLGALRVIGPRLLWVATRRGLAPPSWPTVRYTLIPGLLFVGAIVLGSSFAAAAARPQEHWFFYLPDRVLWCLPYAALGWLSWPESRMLGHRGITRAADVAKITAVVCASTLSVSGWFGPLLRQQYLARLGLQEFQTSSVHQWTLPELWARLHGFPGIPTAMIVEEFHWRLLAPALALMCGILGWAGVRASRVWNGTFAAMSSFAGVVAWLLFLRVSSLATPRLSSERIAAEWIAVAAVAALAVLAIQVLARIERHRRTVLEARVVVLLQAIADVKQTCARNPRGHA